jgi:multidrug efflux pump subunit AcrA (membrane-fusion protein)
VNPYLRTALAAIVAAACSSAESADSGKSPGPGGGAPPPMPVEVVVAASDTVVDAINASGQIEPIQSIELRPDIEGRLTRILVREGRTVTRGTALFKVDDAELRAEVARAQAERDLARQAPATSWPNGRPRRRISSAPKPRPGAPRRSTSCCPSGSSGPRCAPRSRE